MRYNFNWPVIWRNSDKLFDGLLLGLGIAVVALAAGCVIGIVLAACRLSRHAVLRIPATVFVEVLRNTPLLLLVFFMYFGLPEIRHHRIRQHRVLHSDPGGICRGVSD